MSDEWKVTHKVDTNSTSPARMADQIINDVFVLNKPYTYTVVNETTGDIKHVTTSRGEEGLGEKIADGDFDYEDD